MVRTWFGGGDAMDAMENDDFAMLGGWSTRGSKGTQRQGGDPPYGGGGSIKTLANTTNPSLEFAGGLVR